MPEPWLFALFGVLARFPSSKYALVRAAKRRGVPEVVVLR
jgi:hypothetical protein